MGHNKNKFNGVEENNLTQSYETAFRGYDGALGRFAQVDPLADLITGISTYHFGYNNPISYNDPLGLIGNNPYGDNPWAREGYEKMTMTPGERWSASQEEAERQGNGYYTINEISSSQKISNQNYTPDYPSAGISTHYETVYTITERMYFYQNDQLEGDNNYNGRIDWGILPEGVDGMSYAGNVRFIDMNPKGNYNVGKMGVSKNEVVKYAETHGWARDFYDLVKPENKFTNGLMYGTFGAAIFIETTGALLL